MKPLNIAILGLGAIAKHMADAVSSCPEFRGWAVAARDKERADAFAAEYGFERSYGSYKTMLEDKDIDLVYIAVPHAFHYQCALMCLNAGKNIVVEKPFMANRAQAEEIIEKARARGLMAAEGIWTCYLPMMQKLRQLCTSGLIGNVHMLSGEIGYHLTQERLYDPHMAGGALLDIGVYLVALAGNLFGYDVADIASSVQMTDRGVDETNSFVLRYRSGVMASFCTSINYMSTCRGTVWGSRGYADIDNANRFSTVTVYGSNKEEITRYATPVVSNGYVFELNALSKALRSGRIDTTEVPHEEIILRMGLMDKLRKQWGLIYPFEEGKGII